MNPFDLPGPEFLVFYVVLIAAVLGLLYAAIRNAEDGSPPVLPLRNPYQIAWLRGGNREAARIAVLSLIDRGLVELAGSQITAKNGVRRSSNHLERAILSQCETIPVEVGNIARDPTVEGICDRYRTELEGLHLAADRAALAYRWRLYIVAAAVLLCVALIKIAIALDRGRSNIGFLVVLAVVGPLGALILVHRRRTRLGDRMLRDLRRLFHRLRTRASTIRRGTMTNDVILLAAVFGFGALPSLYSDVQRAYASTGGDGGGSSCGSSGGGSGCGGGGGCGGCGGS